MCLNERRYGELLQGLWRIYNALWLNSVAFRIAAVILRLRLTFSESLMLANTTKRNSPKMSNVLHNPILLSKIGQRFVLNSVSQVVTQWINRVYKCICSVCSRIIQWIRIKAERHAGRSSGSIDCTSTYEGCKVFEHSQLKP